MSQDQSPFSSQVHARGRSRCRRLPNPVPRNVEICRMTADAELLLPLKYFCVQCNPLWSYISYDPYPTRKVELPFWLWSMFIESYTYHLYGLIAIANIFHYSNDLNNLSEYWDQWKFRMKLPVFNWQWKSGKCHRVTEDADWLHQGMGGHNVSYGSRSYHGDASQVQNISACGVFPLRLYRPTLPKIIVHSIFSLRELFSCSPHRHAARSRDTLSTYFKQVAQRLGPAIQL